MDYDLITTYIQLVHLPNSMIYRVIPELDNPRNELQYQFLKIDYRLQEVTGGIADALGAIYGIMRAPIENIAEKFRRLSDEIFEFDDEICTREDGPIGFDINPKEQLYSYIKDIRKETRMYLRNRVY